MSSASTPFTFEDLGLQEADGPVPGSEFVTLFPVTGPEAPEETTSKEATPDDVTPEAADLAFLSLTRIRPEKHSRMRTFKARKQATRWGCEG